MLSRICSRCILTSLALALGTIEVGAADWPNWRGPNYDGISSETRLKTKWDATPTIVWEREIGPAFSGVTCMGDKIYTCGTQDGQQVLFCLKADNGGVVWKQAYEEKYNDRQGGDGTRGTPTINAGRVYVQGGHGRLLCCDAETGKILWDRKFGSQPQWGYSGSVLIEGDLAITIGGEEDGPLVALDKKTGKTVWQCGSAPIGYSTPLPFTFEGKRYIAGFLGGSILLIDAKSGAELWNMPWETSWNVNAATPIYHDGHLFLSSGYKHGSILLKLSNSGGKLTASKVWEEKTVRAKFQTPVLYEGHLYTSDEVGLKCVDFATGKEQWNHDGIKFGTVVIAEGNLFVLTEKGKLLIGKASPSGFEPMTDVRVSEGRCWTVPTLYQGRLYVRNLEKIVCYQLRP